MTGIFNCQLPFSNFFGKIEKGKMLRMIKQFGFSAYGLNAYEIYKH